ncbi:hypothetical protein LU604_15085 [Erwinia tracheiphila]|uniref:Uncharacterized protein n=1 Tax=Erwinia tracheiphila TaxID=65700 RepID=A0A345CPV5_9GAMM|nr:hypothetical protein [Erwinia tracheiphila]AXF75472.1 hypothetical protein AV903_04120 [Erwinia tracheiphila]UIA81982.1 hypothetical protein LU604_15085 [Erwinia tracheiphila]
MKNILFYIAMGCAIVPFFITVLQFVIFSINNEKYNTLLSMYHNSKFELPPLYKFYGSMGFLGSFGMSYFFSRLKKGKKIIFQPKEQITVSEFLKGIDISLTKWIDNYYYLSISALFLYAVFVVISLIKAVITQL